MSQGPEDTFRMKASDRHELRPHDPEQRYMMEWQEDFARNERSIEGLRLKMESLNRTIQARADYVERKRNAPRPVRDFKSGFLPSPHRVRSSADLSRGSTRALPAVPKDASLVMCPICRSYQIVSPERPLEETCRVCKQSQSPQSSLAPRHEPDMFDRAPMSARQSSRRTARTPKKPQTARPDFARASSLTSTNLAAARTEVTPSAHPTPGIHASQMYGKYISSFISSYNKQHDLNSTPEIQVSKGMQPSRVYDQYLTSSLKSRSSRRVHQRKARLTDFNLYAISPEISSPPTTETQARNLNPQPPPRKTLQSANLSPTIPAAHRREWLSAHAISSPERQSPPGGTVFVPASSTQAARGAGRLYLTLLDSNTLVTVPALVPQNRAAIVPKVGPNLPELEPILDLSYHNLARTLTTVTPEFYRLGEEGGDGGEDPDGDDAADASPDYDARAAPQRSARAAPQRSARAAQGSAPAPPTAPASSRQRSAPPAAAPVAAVDKTGAAVDKTVPPPALPPASAPDHASQTQTPAAPAPAPAPSPAPAPAPAPASGAQPVEVAPSTPSSTVAGAAAVPTTAPAADAPASTPAPAPHAPASTPAVSVDTSAPAGDAASGAGA